MAKIHVDKKTYRARCREQVVNGFINDEKGGWIRPPSQRSPSVDIAAGYRLGTHAKKRRTKAAPPVED